MIEITEIFNQVTVYTEQCGYVHVIYLATEKEIFPLLDEPDDTTVKNLHQPDKLNVCSV